MNFEKALKSVKKGMSLKELLAQHTELENKIMESDQYIEDNDLEDEEFDALSLDNWNMEVEIKELSSKIIDLVKEGISND